MHLPEMIPLGGRLYIHEGLELGLKGVRMDVPKAGYGRVGWISVSSTCLLVYSFASLKLPPKGMIEARSFVH